MNGTVTIVCDVHIDRRGKGGRKAIVPGPPPATEPGRVPRVARWMALAIHWDGLLRDGVIASYRDLAELGNVSRPRVTQVMNLLYLAPDIRGALLDLPRSSGRDPVLLRDLQPIAATLDWRKQRKMWKGMR